MKPKNDKMKYTVLIFILFIKPYIALTQNINHQYDPLNRLIQTTYNDQTVYSYTYDELGNRTKRTTNTTANISYDFSISSITTAPNTLMAGGKVNLTATYQNNGDSEASSVTVWGYWSADDNLDMSDEQLITFTVSGIPANGNKEQTNQIDLSANLVNGTGYLILFVDAPNTFTETDENNNVSEVQVTIDNGLVAPNLLVQNVVVNPTTISLNTPFDIAYTIANDGTADAGASAFKVYLSDDIVKDDSDVEIVGATRRITAIGAGNSNDYSETISLPESTVAGQYYLLFVADADRVLGELDEGDNIAFSIINMEDVPCGQINPPVVEWDKTIGGNEYDNLEVILYTSDGGTLICGYSETGINGDKTEDSKGNSDYWIVKLDGNGNKAWDKSFGGPGIDKLIDAIKTTDNGYLLGGYSLSSLGGDKTEPSKGNVDYWVVKIDENGNKLWDRTFGGSHGDLLTSLVLSSDGGYLLGGYSSSPIGGDKTEESKGIIDYWVVKIDINGIKQWDKTFGGDANDYFSNLVRTSDNGYLLGGTTISISTGDKSDNSRGKEDYWVMKIDENGNKLWDKTFGGSEYDRLEDILIDDDNNFLLVGRSESPISGEKTENSKGGLDYWIVKVNTNGNKLWDRTFGGSLSDFAYFATNNTNGYLIVGGSSSNMSGDKIENSRGDSDMWLVQIDKNGNLIWNKTIGSNLSDNAKSTIINSDNSIIVGAYTLSGFAGEKTETNKGGADYWVVKLKPITEPTANFQNTIQDQLVTFTNTSVDATSYSWDFGDGNSSTEEEPMYSYSNGGNYNVCLTVTNDCGNDEVCQTIAIEQPPCVTNLPPSVDWDKTFGGSTFDYLEKIIVNDDGTSLLVGRSGSSASGDKTLDNNGGWDGWIIKVDENGNKIWDKPLGGSDTDRLIDGLTTADGGYILAGSTSSEISGDVTQVGRGSADYWMIKIDANGNRVWDKRFGGDKSETFYKIIRTADSGYLLLGYTSSANTGDKSEPSRGSTDFWILKVDESGNKIWDKRFGGSGIDLLRDAVLTNDEGFLIGGITASAISGDITVDSKGGNDYWIIKIDKNGNKEWDKRFGGDGSDNLGGIANTSDGGFLIGGNSDSGISGDRTQSSKGKRDHWVIKLDANGNKIWDKAYGGSGSETLYGIHQIGNQYIISGQTESSMDGDVSEINRGLYDYWTIKIDGSGNKIWDKLIGGSDDETPFTLEFTTDGYLIGGQSKSNTSGDKSEDSRGGFDYWIVKMKNATSPIADFQFEINDNIVNFTNNSENATTFTWDFGDNTTSTAIEPIHTYMSIGSFEVCLTATNDCGDDISCQTINVAPVIPSCIERDSLALIALYNATDGANWQDKWDLTQPINTWHGITLTEEGCVKEIDLFANSLKGTIPQEIGNISELTDLKLHLNQLSGVIPSTLNQLKELSYLTLALNDLTGNIPDLSALTKLELLFLQNNELAGTIPIHLQDLTSLRVLNLRDNNFSGVIPSALANLPNLTGLELSDNSLNGAIPAELANVPNLRNINFRNNQLDGTIPGELGDAPKLIYLILENNDLTGIIPAALGNSTTLEGIYLSGNNLFGSIPVELGNIATLKNLKLSDNQLKGTIPDVFTNTNLVECNVQINQFTFEDILPKYAQNNEIAIFQYNLQDSIFKDTSYIRDEGTLLTIDLEIDDTVSTNTYNWYKDGNFYTTITGDNELIFSNIQLADAGTYSCEIVNPIAPELTLLSREIQVVVNEVIPPCRAIDSLALVALYNATNGANWITSWDLTQPINTWHGVVLNEDGCVQEIALFENNLDGIIPTGIGNLENLTKLNFYENKLTGSIPIELGNLSELRELQLGNNQLSGSIPVQLGNLMKLERLSLFNNTLTGTIPVVFGNLSNLTWLELRINKLQGEIPVELGNLSNLTTLSLEENQLTGTIPLSLQNLSELYYLRLRANRLNGNIPKELGLLPKLLILQLDNNFLTGTIPPELGDLITLIILDLNDNRLDGEIPKALGNLDDLLWLRLNNNSLTGNIPAELGNLTSLQLLHLDNNDLSGLIPTELTNLNQLTQFYIERNRFTFQDLRPSSDELVGLQVFQYHQQDSIFDHTTYTIDEGELLTVDLGIDDTVSTNVYQWYKGGILDTTVYGNNQLMLNNIQLTDAGVYHCEVSNPNLPNLTLISRKAYVGVNEIIPTCRQVDSLALVAFYNATDGPNWTTTWDLHQSINTWHGITINEEGCVSRLILNDNNLKGTIPTEIGQLSSLENINLSKDSIYGSLPLEIYDLVELEFLYLSDLELSGSIPANINQLQKLRLLNLEKNKLTGGIPVEIGDLSELWSLNLSFNELAGSIPSEIGNLSNLSGLNLLSNQLTGTIPVALGNLANISVLTLQNNQLTGTIPVEFGALPKLFQLDLSANKLEGTIPATLGNATELRRLQLWRNNLSGTIPSALGNLTNLEWLYLSENNLNGSIPSELSNLTKLERVYLQKNNLSGLIPNLTAINNLEELWFRQNEFTFEDLLPNFNSFNSDAFFYEPQDSVFNDTTYIKNEGEILIIYLKIDDTVSTNIYKWYKDGVLDTTIVGNNSLLFDNIQLMDTGVYNCEITNPNAPELTLTSRPANVIVNEVIPTCRQVDSLALIAFYNATNGANWTEKWDLNQSMDTWYGVTLSAEGCVTELKLTENGLKGIIPPEIGTITNLRHIALGKDSLSGSIPSEFYSLSELNYIFLSQNQLSGSISSEIERLSKLAFVNLSSNDLDGPIPPEIGNLPSLWFLSLSSNELTGSIPSQLANASNLRTVSLSYNELTGSIPAELGSMAKLEFINLGNNSLSGGIPKELGTSPELKQLSLMNNQLEGIIPLELGNIATLTRLELEDNKLTGSIPIELGDLQNLVNLRLSDNQLTGNIPTEIGMLNNLQQLVLSHNQFTDTLPATLGNLDRLYMLKVADNEFEGLLPNLSNLQDLNILEVEQNNFTFEDLLFNITNLNIGTLNYHPQGSIFKDTTIFKNQGDFIEVSLGIDEQILSNKYTWYKNDAFFSTIYGSNTFDLDNLSYEDAGIYHCEVTNTNASDLTLVSRKITLNIMECATDDILLSDTIKGQKVFRSKENIVSDAQISVDGQTMYMAEKSVILQPGFHAMAGCDFTAMIGSCNAQEPINQSQFSNQYNTNIETKIDEVILKISPNPTSQNIQIDYNLPSSQEINLYLVSATTGKLVRQIERRERKEQGFNSKTLFVEELSQGVYFIILEGVDFSVSNKMIVIK